MPGRELIRILLFAFAGAFFLYVFAYRYIEGRRVAKGPWEVTFIAQSNEPPRVQIAQPALGISNVNFTFPEGSVGSNIHKRILFDTPDRQPAFGERVFVDTTFLPGTITLNLFSNEIELLPRVLYINRRQVPWKNDTNIVITGTTNLPPHPKKPRQ